MDLTLDLLKSFGPSGIISVVLWVMLRKSEIREEKKDLRIQLLENLLTESYDERIEAAEQVSHALRDNSVALTALTNELKGRKRNV